jgi:hypothetical protein
MKWKISPDFGFVPHRALLYCSFAAVALAAAMAVWSDYNRHPDEIHHFLAANYYAAHFFPPEIGAPEVRDSYSVYGVSYLNYHWIEYFLAGKFIFLLSPLVENPLYAARFFNVSLLAALLVFFFLRARRAPEIFIFGCALLITPQIWYVFSYVNNDAFALFVSLVAAYQIGYEKSFLNEFLQTENLFANAAGGVFFGLLTGVLLIVKTNYWAFLLFAALWLALKFPFNSNSIKKYIFIALVAFLVLGFRVGLDFYVNGETNFVGVSYINYFLGNFEQKQNRLLAYQEEIAEKPYKPSTVEKDLAATDPAMKLKAKGTSFKQLFTGWRWHEVSFASFVGGYGYMNLWASRRFYQFMALVYAVFGLYLMATTFYSKNPTAIKQFATTGFGVLLTILISVYLSWTYAFQAQGRYLFPAVGMVALFVYANRNFFHKQVLNAFVAATFLLSVYSFVFVALAKINQN